VAWPYDSGSELPHAADQSNGRDIFPLITGHFLHIQMIASFSEQYLSQRFNDFSDIDSLRAAGIAHKTGFADPNGTGVEEFFLKSELGESNDLIGKNVHLRNGWTSRRTLSALVTCEEVLPA